MPAAAGSETSEHEAMVARLEAAARQAARLEPKSDPLVEAAENRLAPPEIVKFYSTISPDRQKAMKTQGEKIAQELAAAMSAGNERGVLAHQTQIAKWLKDAGANKAYADQHAKLVVDDLRPGSQG